MIAQYQRKHVIFKQAFATKHLIKIQAPLLLPKCYTQSRTYVDRKPNHAFLAKKLSMNPTHEPIQTIEYYGQSQNAMPESCNYETCYTRGRQCDSSNHSFIHCNTEFNCNDNDYISSKLSEISNKLNKNKKTLLLECKHVLYEEISYPIGGLPPRYTIGEDTNKSNANENMQQNQFVFDPRKGMHLQAS